MSDEKKREQEPKQATIQALAEIASGWLETADHGANGAQDQMRRLYGAYLGISETAEQTEADDIGKEWASEPEYVKAEVESQAKRLFGPVEEQPFVRMKDGAPEWIENLVHVVHDDCKIPPDNYRYEFIEIALDTLAEANDEDHMEDLRAELEADPYTAGLTAWLHSTESRVYYLSEVLGAYGGDLDGFQALGMAQVQEKQEVFDKVRECLRGLVESAEAGESARCDNCLRVWPVEVLAGPAGLAERVDPGGPEPVGECPGCGALCYPFEG